MPTRDYNFVTGVTSAIEPTASAPVDGSDLTTKTYVDALLTNLTVASVSSTGTVGADTQLELVDTSGGAVTRTLPTAVGNSGKILRFQKNTSDDNAVTLDGNASETIGGTSTYLLRQYRDTVALVSDNANWQILNYWFSPQRLAATSSAKTPSGGSIWLNMTGNELSIGPGHWRLFGSIHYGNNGSSPAYTGAFWCKWASGDGADSASEPTSLTVTAGRADSFLPVVASANSQGYFNASNPITFVSSTTTIYLAVFVPGLTTASNSRVTAYLIAERVG